MKEDKRLSPFQKFVKIESFSGLLLFGATIIAILWANSQWGDVYESIWKYKLGFGTQGFSLNKPLILWINDGLMAIFFFLIGLEIKRELMIGELNSFKKASFPLLAAVGGMLLPLTIYMVMNQNPTTAQGWGIPMATDIAFSLAILRLLGNKVPLGLKIFLTAFAIVDDLGAVIVIAVFYSGSIQWMLLLYAAILLSVLFILAYKGLYYKYLIFGFGLIIWVLFLKAGIHPTIAGVLLAFTVPIRQKIDVTTFTDKLGIIVSKIKIAADNNIPILTKEQIDEIDNLEDWTNCVQSPLQHLEHKLHNWVSYFIMPIFALANAGVAFNFVEGLDYSLIINLAVSLIVGNVLGVGIMSFIGIKLGIAKLPDGVTIRHMLGVSFLAGVGFTMSIFIASIAFANDALILDAAKMGIILGSTISGIIGYLILRK